MNRMKKDIWLKEKMAMHNFAFTLSDQSSGTDSQIPCDSLTKILTRFERSENRVKLDKRTKPTCKCTVRVVGILEELIWQSFDLMTGQRG